MSKYLLQITIGPVQAFIASARKLRDLWFGSYLLSELSKTVARSLDEQDAELIFPAIKNPDDLQANSDLIVANKILAILELEGDPDSIIAKARAAWESHWKTLGEGTIEKMTRDRISFNEPLFRKQLMDEGEFYAAWVEWDGDYQDAKARLEKLLAGRKNLRAFEVPAWNGKDIPKNSLDGKREAVIGDAKTEIKGLLKKSERLDCLGCIKRFYPLRPDQQQMLFDDLADIALTPYLKGLEKTRNAHLLAKLKVFEASLSGSQFRIPESVQRQRPKYGNLTVQSELLYASKEELGDRAFSCLIDLISNKAAGPPHKYACLLLGDGDDMGSVINAIKEPEEHKQFTEALSQFAATVKNLICSDEYDGSLIYSGGDDVLAYVPLHTMLECADEIRKAFTEIMAPVCMRITKKQPTFSIGMAIVHHSEQLSYALELVRKAERLAKEKGGKNALAIIRHKRGGSDICITGKWENGTTEEIIPRLNAMCSLYKERKLPTRLAYQLYEARVSAGKDIQFNLSEEGQILIPQNASSALILKIFDQKEHQEDLKVLLKNQTSIEDLSDQLVIAWDISKARKMSRGEFNDEI